MNMPELSIILCVTMHFQKYKMKKIVGLLILCLFVLAACGPKPAYKTAKGKKKQKYYNEIQFGGKSAIEMKKKY